MAGAGFKTFGVGDVLTASDVNTYLMQQSAMVFADSAARDAALGTATGGGNALAEGMVSYRADGTAVEFYDGSAWTAIGSDPNPGIGTNVVTDIETATYTESVATGTESAAVLSAAITPTSASSKVLVQVNINGGLGLSGFYSTAICVVRRGGTLIGAGDAASNRTSVSAATIASANDENSIANTTISFLDSPASTSALTYAVHLFNPTSSTRTVYLNRTVLDNDVAARVRTISTLTLTEVAA